MYFDFIIERITSLDSFLEPLYSTKIFWIFIAFAIVRTIASAITPLNRKSNEKFEKEFEKDYSEIEKTIKKSEEYVNSFRRMFSKKPTDEELMKDIESRIDYEAGIWVDNGVAYKIISE